MENRATRIDAGALVCALGALVLAVSLSLDWFEPSMSAWTVFEIVDLLLAAAAAGALLIAADRLGAPTLIPGELLVPLSALAAVLVVTALLNHPPAAVGLGVEPGAWIGLGGALLMVAGAALTVVRVSFALDINRAGAERGPASPGAASDREPATPASASSSPAGAAARQVPPDERRTTTLEPEPGDPGSPPA